MHFILCVSLILINIFYQVQSQKSSTKCPAKIHAQADETVFQLLTFGSPERKWPTNQAEFKQFCKDDRQYRESIKKYTDKCLFDLSKQTTNLLMYSILKTNTNICKSKKRADEFVENAKCANAAKKETMKCFKDWVLKIKNIHVMDNHKMKIPVGCCSNLVLGDCFDKAYEKFPNDCSFKQMSGLRRLFEAYLTDVMAFFCGEYSGESDKCEPVIPLLPTKIKATTDKSMMSGMIALFESIPKA